LPPEVIRRGRTLRSADFRTHDRFGVEFGAEGTWIAALAHIDRRHEAVHQLRDRLTSARVAAVNIASGSWRAECPAVIRLDSE